MASNQSLTSGELSKEKQLFFCRSKNAIYQLGAFLNHNSGGMNKLSSEEIAYHSALASIYLIIDQKDHIPTHELQFLLNFTFQHQKRWKEGKLDIMKFIHLYTQRAKDRLPQSIIPEDNLNILNEYNYLLSDLIDVCRTTLLGRSV